MFASTKFRVALFLLFKNNILFSENIQAEICEIIRIFWEQTRGWDFEKKKFVLKICKSLLIQQDYPSFSKRQNKPESNKNSISCMFDTVIPAGWLQNYSYIM